MKIIKWTSTSLWILWRSGLHYRIGNSSGYGNKTVYGPKSDCSYYTDISKRAENKFVKSYPCSNRPVICEQCQDCYWSYNLTEHYKIKHAGIMCSNQILEEERKICFLRNYNYLTI